MEETVVRVKSLEQSAERYVQNTLRNEPDWIRASIRTYLDGAQSFKWIIGMIRAFRDIVEAARIFREFCGHSNHERYEALALWFRSELAETN